MEIIETHKLYNLPVDPKLIEAQMSSSLGEFLAKQQGVALNYIEIKFVGGTPSKSVMRELK